MAPKKKSKKPAGNPARGFATTSTMSKSKIADTTEDPQEETKPSNGEVEDSKISNSNSVSVEETNAKGMSELTPDQLEAQLEEDDLQNLIDAHRDQCFRTVNRLASRLKTERRLLRNSAQRLDMTKWLSETLTDSMMRLASATLAGEDHGDTNGEAKYDNFRLPIVGNESQTTFEMNPKLLAMTEDDLTIKIWTLKLILKELGFVEAKSEMAIINLLQNVNAFLSVQMNASKDGAWGLHESVEWLAQNCDADELPCFDSHVTPVQERVMSAKAQESKRVAEEHLNHANAMAHSRPIGKNHATDAASELLPEGADSGEETHSSDSDIEPINQLEKYLQFKTRLYRRRPDLTEVTSSRGKKSKLVQKESPRRIDPRSAKLVRRIRTLERDLLFDTEQAHERWAEMRLVLVAEESRERRQTKKSDIPEPSADSSNVPVTATADEDESLGFGEFFASLPEPAGEATGASMVTSVDESGAIVRIRDFGTGSGVSPRKILEETCKIKDSGYRIVYTPISSGSFSHRHEILIVWSKNEDQPFHLDLEGIEQTSTNRFLKAKMTSTACVDGVQSESYISVITLFLLGSLREEKSYLRLPSIWRELWSELQAVKREQIDKADRIQLQYIRELVRLHYRIPDFFTTPKSEPSHGVEANDTSIIDNDVPKSRTSVLETIDEKPFKSSGDGISVAEISDISRSNNALQAWQTRADSAAYQNMLRHRVDLPIWDFKDELLKIIDEHQAVIVCGETGCGKSTQLPAYVLEHNMSRSLPCKIYCTQPRRISAVSLARRVSEELGERRNDIGTARSLVGYAIRLESQMTAQTSLIYATTGIVMRMLEKGNQLQGITHIILDEVHERNIDSDFLLIILRRLMAQRPELKVILMSATVNAEQFSAYLGGIPIVDIPGRTFPVEAKFLEDAIEETGYGSVQTADRRKHNEEVDESDESPEDTTQTEAADLTNYSLSTRNVLKDYNEYRINYDLILRLLDAIANQPRFAAYSKAILVFLPGIGEIRRLNDIIGGHHTFGHGWQILPLHSTISTEEQERAFVIPPRGVRKIVLATNIAETGITIPDVTCVIDTGKHKEMRFDERRQLSRLIETFISRANAKQRRGRAGRVQSGLCFHLFTRNRLENILPDAQTPEMLRLSLQDLALRVKICRLGEIEAVLAEALSPPLAKNVRRAIDSLIEVKALTVDQSLTALGRRLATLPLDVYLGKLVLLSCVFNCLDAGLTIAAILSSKTPFTAPMAAKQQADQARLAFKKGDSDLMTVYNVYCAWRRICQTAASSEFHFCRRNHLSPHTLSNIEDLKAQLAAALLESGSFQAHRNESQTQLPQRKGQRSFVQLPPNIDLNSNNPVTIGSVIAWSFYPKLLIREGNSFRNVANNQNVSIHPASVNKGLKPLPHFVTYYHIMQASSKANHAHETTVVEDLAVAIGCGGADFKLYSGVMSIDSNRVRFGLSDWKSILLIKAFRKGMDNIIANAMKHPTGVFAETDQAWFDLWQEIFARQGEEKR